MFLDFPNKTFSGEVSALRVNKAIQQDINLVLEGFKDYYSKETSRRKPYKKAPKIPK